MLMTLGRGVQRSPGEFRRNQVWIGGHRADEATCVPPPANQLADCWAALENFINDVPQPTAAVIPPFLDRAKSRGQAAKASFCFGVMPPSAMLGRS